MKLAAETRRLRDQILAVASARGVPLEQHVLRLEVGLPVLRLRLGAKVLWGSWVRLPGSPGPYQPDAITVHGSGFRSSKMWPRKRDGTFDIEAITSFLLAVIEQEVLRAMPDLVVPAGVPAATSGLHVVHIAAVQLGALNPDLQAEVLIEGVAEQTVRERIKAHLLRGGLTDRDMRVLSDAAGLSLYTPRFDDFDPFEPVNDTIMTMLLVGKAKGSRVDRRYVLVLDHRGTEVELADPAGEGRTVVTPKELMAAWKLGAKRGRSWVGTVTLVAPSIRAPVSPRGFVATSLSATITTMALFDYYVMVDWSALNGRKGGRPDTIWIAHGSRVSVTPTTISPASRTDAEAAVRDMLAPYASGEAGAVLVCFDFAYGYPSGVASHLAGSGPGWLRVWEHLAASVKDDLGTKNGRVPSNKNNRFVVGDALNAALSPDDGPCGPFWCTPSAGVFPHIPQNKPGQPFSSAKGIQVGPLRRTDVRASSDTPFRLFGTGSVGSQVLLGIARLHSLRFDPSLAARSRVWPFETNWAPNVGAWLHDTRIVHAEIYPSVRAPLPDAIKDRGQVRSMWHWARDLDAAGALQEYFGRPPSVLAGSATETEILQEEGWILGCP